MINLTYKIPIPPPRQFRPGDIVEVLDRDHRVLSRQKVVIASGRMCITECGRVWAQDGWRIDSENVRRPFPSIRLVEKAIEDDGAK